MNKKKVLEKWHLCKEKPVKMHNYQENHTFQTCKEQKNIKEYLFILKT